MAFWALGKVKNLSQKLNIQDYKELGSKIIKNYMNTEEQDEFFDFNTGNNNKYSFSKQENNKKPANNDKQNLSQTQWLEIQIHQYKKLTKLQDRILKAHQQEQQQRLANQYAELQKQLEELDREEEVESEQIEKEKLKAEIKLGQKNIAQLIKENIQMKQHIQKINLHH